MKGGSGCGMIVRLAACAFRNRQGLLGEFWAKVHKTVLVVGVYQWLLVATIFVLGVS